MAWCRPISGVWRIIPHSSQGRLFVSIRTFIRPIPGVRQASLLRQRMAFTDSARYWDRHYSCGGDSGDGSYGDAAAEKAAFLNKFVIDNEIGSVVEFGSGDGHQLSLASYPHYIGLDVSKSAIQLCKSRFSSDLTKSFFLYEGSCFVDHAHIFEADLAISLDVIYHLVEDSVFETYVRHLFDAAKRYVIIYSTNTEIRDTAPHVRHRRFQPWVERSCPEWVLTSKTSGPNSGPGRADFFVYGRNPGMTGLSS